MYCEKCGKPVQPGDGFCMNCGAEISSTGKTETAAAELLDTEVTLSNQIETGAVFAAEEETGGRKKRMSKKFWIIAGSLTAVICVVIGVSAFFLVTGSAEEVPRDYEEASKYFDKNFETAQQQLEKQEYETFFETVDRMETAISKVMEEERDVESKGEEFKDSDAEHVKNTYSDDIVKLCSSSLDRLIEAKVSNAMEVMEPLYKDKKYAELSRFYEPEMLNASQRSEVLDMMATAFSETGEFENTDMVLREMLRPFSKEALDKTLEFKEYLNKEYPKRERAWTQIDAGKYDKVMQFDGGLAKVAVNEAPADSGEKKYKWGLINSDGDVVVKTEYDMIGMFLEGLAAVQKDGKWGFMDESGKLVIPLQYEDIKETQDNVFYAYVKRDPELISRGFYNGFAAVKKNGKWGYIDKDGEEFGEGFVYDDVICFSEDIAAVEKGENYGLISSSGDYIIKPNHPNQNGINFEVVRSIYEGLAGANWNDRKERGLVDRYGNLVTVFNKEDLDLIQDFREGLASVRKYDPATNKSKWGFVDRDGSITIPIQYDTVTVFIDGVAMVSNDGEFGLINRNGETVLPAVYESISLFHNDFAIIQKGGLYGFTDRMGNIIAEPKYTSVTEFSNGIAGVMSAGKWGAIGEDGRTILEPVFENLKIFNNGVAPAQIDGKWGFIDRSGYFVVDPIFEKAYPFYEGLAAVKQDGEYKYIRLEAVPVNLDGKVTDDMEEPVGEAEVTVFHQDALRTDKPICTAKTNDDGMFKIVIPSGSYKLFISKEGYIDSYSYENIEDIDKNYATTVNLIRETGGQDADASVKIGNALTGEGLPYAEVFFRNGYNHDEGGYVKDGDGTRLSVKTGGDGTFTVSLPVGLYTAEARLDGYATTYINFMAGGQAKNAVRNQAMTQVLPDGETRITLEWGELPPDLDSHLLGPVPGSYERFHIYYPVKGENIADCMLDKDDTSGNGFETTTIYRQTDGSYTFCVFDFTNQSDYSSYAMSESGARVSVYRKDSCIAVYDIPTNRVGNLWEVFQLDGDKITTLNNVTNHHDQSFYTY